MNNKSSIVDGRNINKMIRLGIYGKQGWKIFM